MLWGSFIAPILLAFLCCGIALARPVQSPQPSAEILDQRSFRSHFHTKRQGELTIAEDLLKGGKAAEGSGGILSKLFGGSEKTAGTLSKDTKDASILTDRGGSTIRTVRTTRPGSVDDSILSTRRPSTATTARTGSVDDSVVGTRKPSGSTGKAPGGSPSGGGGKMKKVMNALNIASMATLPLMLIPPEDLEKLAGKAETMVTGATGHMSTTLSPAAALPAA